MSTSTKKYNSYFWDKLKDTIKEVEDAKERKECRKIFDNLEYIISIYLKNFSRKQYSITETDSIEIGTNSIKWHFINHTNYEPISIDKLTRYIFVDLKAAYDSADKYAELIKNEDDESTTMIKFKTLSAFQAVSSKILFKYLDDVNNIISTIYQIKNNEELFNNKTLASIESTIDYDHYNIIDINLVKRVLIEFIEETFELDKIRLNYLHNNIKIHRVKNNITFELMFNKDNLYIFLKTLNSMYSLLAILFTENINFSTFMKLFIGLYNYEKLFKEHKHELKDVFEYIGYLDAQEDSEKIDLI